MGSHPRCAGKSRWLHVQRATVTRVVAMGSGEQPIDAEGVTVIVCAEWRHERP
jgi:hypothetical protein